MPALRADTGDGQLERAGEQTGLVGYKVVGETKITLMHKKKLQKNQAYILPMQSSLETISVQMYQLIERT